MLGNLFGSNARVKILKLFLLHPEKKYYIRQLARDLDLQVNSVRRELDNLEKFGLLKSSIGKEEDPVVVVGDDNDLKDLLAGKIVKAKVSPEPIVKYSSPSLVKVALLLIVVEVVLRFVTNADPPPLVPDVKDFQPLPS